MSNLTQHQKDDYLIYIKSLSNQGLFDEYILTVQCENTALHNNWEYLNKHWLWCQETCLNELKLRLGDWLDK